MLQGRRTSQSFAPTTENGSTSPWIFKHPTEKVTREAAANVSRVQAIWDALAKALGHVEERISLLPGREFGIILQIKPFTAEVLSASSSPCTRAPLPCPGSEQELFNECKCCWRRKYLPSEPARAQNLLWRCLTWTRSFVLWKEHPSWEWEMPPADFWEGKVPKALCWLQLRSRSTIILFFWFRSAPGMIKL